MLSWSRPGDESGAVLVFTAALMLVLLGFAALAVDLGQAWSNNRRAQTSTDVAVMGGLQTIPHTFRDGYVGNPPAGGAESVATAEVLNLIGENNGTAGIVNVDLAPLGGNVSITAAATIDSPNAFARAIGAGSLVTVDGAATGEILINESELDLLPLGFDAPSNPFRCVSHTTAPPPPASGCIRTASPQPSEDVLILAHRRSDTTSPCSNLAETMTANFASGADHLVDLLLPAEPVRPEQDACTFGHRLTMPNTSQTIALNRGDFSAYITAGLGGRIAGNTETLWGWLQPSLGAPCDDAAIAGLPTLEEQSAAMATCLATGNPQFKAGLAGSTERLVWAIDTAAGGTGVTYQDYVLVWINTVITTDGVTFTDHVSPPGGPIVGFTAFILDPSTLNDTIEFDPGGIDNLEFQLTG